MSSETIAEKIKYYRKKLNLSQEELGQKLFVSKQTISLWEKGQTVPTVDNLIRLKEIFSVSSGRVHEKNFHGQSCGRRVQCRRLERFGHAKNCARAEQLGDGFYFQRR